MDIFELIQKRFSVRKYQDREVEEEKIRKLLETARLAPSASNRQEWRFIVVRDPEKRARLREAAHNQAFVGNAPVVFVCCAETDEHVMSCGELSYPIDVAIAMDHIALSAVELGLGSCWVGAFDQPPVKELLGIPDEIKVVQLLALGYPAAEPKPRKRIPLDEIVHYEKW